MAQASAGSAAALQSAASAPRSCARAAASAAGSGATNARLLMLLLNSLQGHPASYDIVDPWLRQRCSSPECCHDWVSKRLLKEHTVASMFHNRVGRKLHGESRAWHRMAGP